MQLAQRRRRERLEAELAAAAQDEARRALPDADLDNDDDPSTGRTSGLGAGRDGRQSRRRVAGDSGSAAVPNRPGRPAGQLRAAQRAVAGAAATAGRARADLAASPGRGAVPARRHAAQAGPVPGRAGRAAGRGDPGAPAGGAADGVAGRDPDRAGGLVRRAARGPAAFGRPDQHGPAGHRRGRAGGGRPGGRLAAGRDVHPAPVRGAGRAARARRHAVAGRRHLRRLRRDDGDVPAVPAGRRPLARRRGDGRAGGAGDPAVPDGGAVAGRGPARRLSDDTVVTLDLVRRPAPTP